MQPHVTLFFRLSLVGAQPCFLIYIFSVAAFFFRIVEQLSPCWVVTENLRQTSHGPITSQKSISW
jgi:hypothetical protein